MNLKKWMAAALLFASAVAHAEEDGFLVIEVDTELVSDVDRDTGHRGMYTDRFWVMNLATQKRYGGMGSLQVLTLPPGLYCVESVGYGRVNQFVYCGEPYFKVVSGKLSNAGNWRFGVSMRQDRSKLFGSLEEPERVLADAIKVYPQLFE